MKKRIVVTGLGCVCPVGLSTSETWDSVLKGRSGVARTTIFDPTGFPSQIAAEVKKFSERFPEIPARYQHSGRNIHFAVAASREAVADASIKEGTYPAERIGIYTGASEGGPNFMEYMGILARARDDGHCDLDLFNQLAMRELSAEEQMAQEPSMVPAHLASEFGFQGPNINTLTACAAAAQAIGESAELIRSGVADVMLTGGTSSMIHPFGVTGFCLLTTLSKRNDEPQRASRPFDSERDGFVLGEGAGMLVLEEYEAAKRRGAKIYAELSGYGTTADAYRATDIHPEARGATTAIQLALGDARLQPEQIGYINAHGTSTKANDVLETLAIRKVFGSSADQIPVSSTKSMTGHLVSASGGIEAIFSILALRDGMLPPTINYENPDPACDLDYIPNKAREKKVDHVLSNSFGFGGQNVSLIFSRA